MTDGNPLTFPLHEDDLNLPDVLNVWCFAAPHSVGFSLNTYQITIRGLVTVLTAGTLTRHRNKRCRQDILLVGFQSRCAIRSPGVTMPDTHPPEFSVRCEVLRAKRGSKIWVFVV